MTHGETSARTAETVAVLGAGGTMGFAMARNIARAGLGVRARNRTADKAAPLAGDGAYIAATPAEAAAGADIVLTMLSECGRCRHRDGVAGGRATGPDEARPRVQPVFDAIGHRTIHAGQAGAGARLKLVASSWVLAVVETGAETVALAGGSASIPRCSSRPSRAARLTCPACGPRPRP